MAKLTILWLDDQRDPYSYLSKKSNSATFARNKQFYDKLMKQYNTSFVWVKNLYQFIDYIEKNGVPQFVSFDHDLNNRGGGEGLSDEQKLNNNGVQCAKWLVNYCRQNNQPLPKFYVHSANPKHGPEINKVMDAGLGENKTYKRVIKLTENDLHKVIKESVKKVLNEIGNTTKGQYLIGRLNAYKNSDEIDNYARKAQDTEKDINKKRAMRWSYNRGKSYDNPLDDESGIIDENEFKEMCLELFPYEKFVEEIESCTGDKEKYEGEYKDNYFELIDNFIHNSNIYDFYDENGTLDEYKLKKELEEEAEYDILGEY